MTEELEKEFTNVYLCIGKNAKMINASFEKVNNALLHQIEFNQQLLKQIDTLRAAMQQYKIIQSN